VRGAAPRAEWVAWLPAWIDRDPLHVGLSIKYDADWTQRRIGIQFATNWLSYRRFRIVTEDVDVM